MDIKTKASYRDQCAIQVLGDRGIATKGKITIVGDVCLQGPVRSNGCEVCVHAYVYVCVCACACACVWLSIISLFKSVSASHTTQVKGDVYFDGHDNEAGTESSIDISTSHLSIRALHNRNPQGVRLVAGSVEAQSFVVSGDGAGNAFYPLTIKADQISLGGNASASNLQLLGDVNLVGDGPQQLDAHDENLLVGPCNKLYAFFLFL